MHVSQTFPVGKDVKANINFDAHPQAHPDNIGEVGCAPYIAGGLLALSIGMLLGFFFNLYMGAPQ